jgi:outer membrane protein assembly factor BamB
VPSPRRRWITSSVVVSVLLAAITSAAAEEWSRFRGPNGTGIVPDAGYPIEFGPSRNLKWRSAVRPGKSSPVLGRRHVFLTAYDGGALYTQCFDRETGRLLWERQEAPVRHEHASSLNEPSASTPVTDGENVYVFFPS